MIRLGAPPRGGNVPWDLQDECEMYAREHNRTAKLHCIPPGIWFVRFSLRANDPRLRAVQEGRAEEASEDVYFHVHRRDYDPSIHPVQRQFLESARPMDYLPLDLPQMGPSGVRQFLERGNTWSGRGEFGSHEEALEASEKANADRKERLEKDTRENARDRTRDNWNWLKGNPSVAVPRTVNSKDE